MLCPDASLLAGRCDFADMDRDVTALHDWIRRHAADTVQHAVYSDGRLEAQSGDGRFFFEGQGFLLQQTNSTLTISNRVHTIIKNPRPAAHKK